jgi:FkbM family methyltransferase
MKTAYSILRNDGLARMVDVSVEKAAMWWRHGDCLELGKFIGRPSAIARLDGCRFALDSPVITADLRYLLLSGKHERCERELIRSFVRSDLPVIELGGSLGVVSCVTNRLLDNPSLHLVVEANPMLIPVLVRNRDRNGCRFTVLQRAIAYGGRFARFRIASNVLASAVQAASADAVSVPATTLRDLVEEWEFERCTLICDIEGAEYELVRRDLQTVGRFVDTLILELHERMLGPRRTAEVLDDLRQVGFDILGRSWESLALRNRRFRP